MRSRFLIPVFVAVFALFGCNQEIDQAPKAEVSDIGQSAPSNTTEATNTVSVMEEQSKIEFVGAKITGSHTGVFHEFDGTLDYAGEKPVDVNFTIDLASVETDTKKLDGHLKSADFFDVAKYPTAKFEGTSITEAPAGAEHTHVVTGVLDLHGVQKEVTFPATARMTDQGLQVSSNFSINRSDWQINYRGAPDDLIKEEVLIRLEMMFPKPETATATAQI